MPFVKLLKGDVQLGQTTPDRGVLSLTLDGARILAKHGVKRVFIQDFKPKATSTLFAVGVDGADPGVRAGDEVVVMHKDDVRGCGVAQMDGASMTHLKRGSAVTLRHTVASGKDAAPKPKAQEVAA
jgi:archaeosine synthase